MTRAGTGSGWFSVLVAAIVVVLAALSAASAYAAESPRYDLKTSWAPTVLEPGKEALFKIDARNISWTDAGTAEDLVIKDELPEHVVATGISFKYLGFFEVSSSFCSGIGTRTVTCDVPSFLVPAFGQAPGIGSQGFGEPAQEPFGLVPPMFVKATVDPDASGESTNRATISGGEAQNPFTAEDKIGFGPNPSALDVLPQSYEADVFARPYPSHEVSRRAGDHPYEQRVWFDLTKHLNTESVDGTPWINANGLVKTVEATLPRGAIGNPEATPKCQPSDFARAGSFNGATACPPDTQVGYIDIFLAGGAGNYGNAFFNNPNAPAARVPIYNLVPPHGVPADFAFNAAGLVQSHIYPILDPAQNYAIKTVSPNISNSLMVLGTRVNFWGVPGDESHRNFRAYPDREHEATAGAPFGDEVVQPLLTNPMDCGFDNGGARIRVESYNDPGRFSPTLEYHDPLNVTGCDDPRIRFNPEVDIQPTTRDAGAATGLTVHLRSAQRDLAVKDPDRLYGENGYVQGVGTPPLKKAVVTFPEGMTINPGAAQGLGSCTAAQIGLGTDDPVTCPDNSQYGTLTLHTPILPVNEQPEGFIYIAKQDENPFHSFLSLYLVIQDPERGILVKIPGKLDLDPATGQIRTTFDDLPQFPVSDMEMHLKSGVRSGLVNPTTCGRKRIRAEFFDWADPQTPHVVESGYDITRKADGAPCVNGLGERPFEPKMEAGTVNNRAGSFSPFDLSLARSDNDQEFSQLSVKLPAGLAAKFAGVSICPDAGIAKALARQTIAGSAALEQADPSCPEASQIGTTMVGAGVGVPLAWVPGKVYLAGPYKGAPMSMVVISPASIGPYDLGVITVRTALRVNSTTAQGEATSDPFPLIFQGIPVRIRDVQIQLDRPQFTLNPTSCSEEEIAAHVTGTGADLASTGDDTAVNLRQRFQAADCGNLGFRPRLALRLFGGTHRGAHPRFQATLRPRAGDANIGDATVTLPHSEFIDQGHIRTVCTRVQFAQEACPAGSVYGRAVASTPLFDEPLSGPVYLRSSNHPLPDLVAALKGPAAQPVEIDLDGRITSVHGGIRNTFDLVPDAPVTRFKLTMQGGKRGLLVNSKNLCQGGGRAVAEFDGQNGRSVTLHPKLRNACH